MGEGVISDESDGIRDEDGSEAVTAGESEISDEGDGVGDSKGFRCFSDSILHQNGAVLGIEITVYGFV